MREKIALLWELEQIDTAIQRKQGEIANLDDGSALAKVVEGLREEVAKLRKELEKMQREMRDKELEARSLEEKRKSMEKRMYGGFVSNPKELEAMEKDIVMLKKNQDALEERVIELMYLIEEKTPVLQEMERELQNKEKELQEIQTNYQQTVQTLSNEIASLKEKRAALLPSIDPHLLERYNEIREREGVGVSKVVSGVCSHCNLGVSPRLLSKLQEDQTLVYCEHCGCILYLEK